MANKWDDLESEMETFMGEASAEASKIKVPEDTRTPAKRQADRAKSLELKKYANAERARIAKIQEAHAKKVVENMSPEGRQFYRDRGRTSKPYK